MWNVYLIRTSFYCEMAGIHIIMILWFDIYNDTILLLLYYILICIISSHTFFSLSCLYRWFKDEHAQVYCILSEGVREGAQGPLAVQPPEVH